MKYLITCTNTYRLNTVEEVKELHQELKDNPNFELVAFSYTTKYIKSKGEIVDEYQVAKAKLTFTPEKEPEARFEVEYNEI